MQKNSKQRAVKIIKVLQKATKDFEQPLANQIVDEYGKDPFLILISCLLSLRSRDSVTIHVCRNLFLVAKTPKELLNIPMAKLEKIIGSVNYYKTKARTLHEVSKTIIKDFHGKVPSTQEELLSIKGVGRKTSNLVLGMAFDVPSICVDTHVHKISNQLGLIKTKTPYETEVALEKILPKKYWVEWNRLLVLWGQNKSKLKYLENMNI